MNAYSFSTASQGIRRRSAARASRARLRAFSFTSSCFDAAIHSSADTIGGVCIPSNSLLWLLSDDVVMLLKPPNSDALQVAAPAGPFRCRDEVSRQCPSRLNSRRSGEAIVRWDVH